MTIKSNIVKKEERNINNMQNNLASMIKEKKLFLLDIDGTVALGSELLPGAADFLQTVKENGGIFRFLTNNSSKAASDYVEQFHDWGIETTEEEFITAGTYARDFMKKYYGNEKILVAATETYCSELRKAGLNITDQAGDDVDCVLCAYDTELTYEKLVQVCKQLTETKVPWFATNPDLRCPIDFGMIPRFHLPDDYGICWQRTGIYRQTCTRNGICLSGRNRMHSETDPAYR